MEKNTNKRITKAMQFEYIKELLNGNYEIRDVNGNPYTIEDAAAFIDSEIALLAKKNTKTDGKPTKAQEENAKLAENVLAYVVSMPTGVSATMVMNELNLSSTQKATATLKALTESGRVIKNTIKGKSIFTAA